MASSSLYYKTFNPANIRHSTNNTWLGLCGAEKGFCKFIDPIFGVRALIVLLRNYIKNGHDTIGEIITRFAPPKENDTAQYIQFVVEFMNNAGCYENVIAFNSWSFKLLCQAICEYETGYHLTTNEYAYIIERFSF